MSRIGVAGVSRFRSNTRLVQVTPAGIGSGNSVGADIIQNGSGTNISYTSTGVGFAPSVAGGDDPHAVWDLFSPNADLSCDMRETDGSGIVFRYGDNLNMWRLVWGDFVSGFTTYSSFFSPGTCGFCYLDGGQSFSSRNMCECSDLYGSGTTYGVENGYCCCPQSDYTNYYTSASSSCGCTSGTFWGGCNGYAACMTGTFERFYTCAGASPGTFSPGVTIANYSSRFHLEYRNGSTSWTNVDTITRGLSDFRLRLSGQTIELYFGSYGGSWTLYKTYTSSVHAQNTFHGIGKGNKSASYGNNTRAGIGSFRLDGI